jgi:transposase
MKKLVSDELWAEIEPLLPKHKASAKGGRSRADDRTALTRIIFALRTGIPWQDLPVEMGCGSGSTCWRRLREWQRSELWARLRRRLLERLEHAGKIDWSRPALDTRSLPAKRWVSTLGRTRRTEPRAARNIMSWSSGADCR